MSRGFHATMSVPVGTEFQSYILKQRHPNKRLPSSDEEMFNDKTEPELFGAHFWTYFHNLHDFWKPKYGLKILGEKVKLKTLNTKPPPHLHSEMTTLKVQQQQQKHTYNSKLKLMFATKDFKTQL